MYLPSNLSFIFLHKLSLTPPQLMMDGGNTASPSESDEVEAAEVLRDSLLLRFVRFIVTSRLDVTALRDA